MVYHTTVSFHSDTFALDADNQGGSLLSLKEVTKVYDKRVLALDKISFQMGKGEFFFLVGSNQAGKTTLLRLIASEERPTKGEIVFDEFNSQKMKKKQIPLLRRKMGRIFQDFRLIDDMNIFDNIALSLRIVGRQENKIKDKVRQVLGMVDLSGKGKLFPQGLSSAEKQKAAIARAIVKDPLLLLADEPTLNLDEEGSDEILKLFKKINLFGTAVLVATHDFCLCKNNNTAKTIRIEKGKLI